MTVPWLRPTTYRPLLCAAKARYHLRAKPVRCMPILGFAHRMHQQFAINSDRRRFLVDEDTMPLSDEVHSHAPSIFEFYIQLANVLNHSPSSHPEENE